MTAVFNDPPTLELRVPPATSDVTVAVLGLGYVGLPTTLALRGRLPGDRRGHFRAPPGRDPRRRCRHARPRPSASGRRAPSHHLHLTTDAAALEAADAVMIAVPTPVDENLVPDLRAVRAACASAVEHARAGQILILTSTTYVGTTRELLVEPLVERGDTVGEDIHVAFAPERINPGDALWEQAEVRVLGGVTAA